MESRGRSLAEVAPDQSVAVRRILFECLRARCGALGLAEGDRLRVGRRDDRGVELRSMDGRWVECPAELARFIEVAEGGEREST